MQKLPKDVTINDILGRQDILDVVEKLNKDLSKMKSLVILWQDDEGRCHSNWSGITLSTAVWMLEQTKIDIMLED